MRLVHRIIRAAALILAVALPACSNSSGPSSTLTFRLTDAPLVDAEAILVTFSEVSVHKSGGDFMTVPFAPASASRTCDLKKLVGAQDVLGTGPMEAGHYTQIRLVISSASLYFDNASAGPACAASIAAPSGRSDPVDIPSGEVRLNREFDVPDSGATTITLDFDAEKSIRETGNGRFVMTPVIKVVSVQ